MPYGCDVTRLCSRTGCSEHAAATLTYVYGDAQVWLDDQGQLVMELRDGD